MSAPLRLYGRAGTGSVLIEAQLVLYGLPWEMVDVGDIHADPVARERLRAVNPLAQVPALGLASGEVLTESAAITLYLADLAGSDMLVPGPAAPGRAAFLRWLVFLVANIYASYTYSDVPERFVPGAGAQDFRARVGKLRNDFWRLVEGEVRGPFLVGRFTALDIFVAAMVDWTPGRAWFEAETPKLWQIAEATRRRPDLAPVFARDAG